MPIVLQLFYSKCVKCFWYEKFILCGLWNCLYTNIPCPNSVIFPEKHRYVFRVIGIFLSPYCMCVSLLLALVYCYTNIHQCYAHNLFFFASSLHTMIRSHSYAPLTLSRFIYVYHLLSHLIFHGIKCVGICVQGFGLLKAINVCCHINKTPNKTTAKCHKLCQFLIAQCRVWNRHSGRHTQVACTLWFL